VPTIQSVFQTCYIFILNKNCFGCHSRSSVRFDSMNLIPEHPYTILHVVLVYNTFRTKENRRKNTIMILNTFKINHLLK